MSKLNKCILAGAVAALLSGPAFAAGKIEATNVSFAHELTGDATNAAVNPTAQTGEIVFAVTAPDILIGRTLATGQVTVEATIVGADLGAEPATVTDPGTGETTGGWASLIDADQGNVQSVSAQTGQSSFQFVINPPDNEIGFRADEIFTISGLPLQNADALKTMGGQVTIQFVVRDTTTGQQLSSADAKAVLTSVEATDYALTTGGATIDVFQGKKFFTGGTEGAEATLGTVQILRADLGDGEFASAAGTAVESNSAGGVFVFDASEGGDTVVLTLDIPYTAAFVDADTAAGIYAATSCADLDDAEEFSPVAGNANKWSVELPITAASGVTYQVCAVADGKDIIEGQTIGLTASIDLEDALTVDPAAVTNSQFAVLDYNGANAKVFHFNPATNPSQQSYLRITNTSEVDGQLSIQVTCDNGEVAGTAILQELKGRESVMLNSGDIENGNSAKGILGAGSCGDGKARLDLTGEFGSMEVQNFLRNRTSTGVINTHVNNRADDRN